MNTRADLPIIDIAEFEHDGSLQRPFPRSPGEGQDGGSALITKAVQQALGESGFMYVRGHGIDRALIRQTFATAQRFFNRAHSDKDRFRYRDIGSNFGFQGLEVESLDPANLPDLKETFTMRNALALAQQTERWPDASFRDTSLAFYAASLGAAHRLLNILASCLALPADFFGERHRGENITLRLLRYPANLPARSASQLGAGAHTDYGSITLLFQDEVGGLELRGADGQWRLAPPVADAIIINTGDLMERWTNGRFRSTEHRVRPIAGDKDRYSIALFVDPDSAVEIDCIPSCVSEDCPARYPPVTAGEHIREKIAATHRGKEVSGE